MKIFQYVRLAILTLAVLFSANPMNAQTNLTSERLAKALKLFPGADENSDGDLSSQPRRFAFTVNTQNLTKCGSDESIASANRLGHRFQISDERCEGRNESALRIEISQNDLRTSSMRKQKA